MNKATPAPLIVLRQLDIDQAVLEHAHLRHALKLLAHIVTLAVPIIKTNNATRKIEIYGWGRNIKKHTDGAGFSYILPLTTGTTHLSVQSVTGEVTTVTLSAGTLARLDDRLLHWTEDSHDRLALFLGSYRRPIDLSAVDAFNTALHALACGDAKAPSLIRMYR